MVFVEPGQGGLKREFAPRDLEFLHQVGRARKQNAPAIFDQGKPDCGGQVRLSPARRSKQDQVCTLFQPGIARTQDRNLGARDHGHGIEGKAVERFAGRQLCFAQMPLDTAAITFGDFVLGQRGDQAGAGPAFLVGARGEVGSDQLDGRQAQFIEHEADALGIDCSVGRFAHAASPISNAS
jgi:hypothetical protein